MDQLSHKFQVFSDGSLRELPLSEGNLWRILGDEELAKYKYISRTADPTWKLGRQTPSVFRFYPVPKDNAGDFRIDVSSLKSFFLQLNGNISRKFEYWIDPLTAQFNSRGWPMMAYITMSRNFLRGVIIGDFLRFETLKLNSNMQGLTFENNPDKIHRFDIVGIDRDSYTYHTNITPQGIIDYPLVTKEGVAYIHERYVVKV